MTLIRTILFLVLIGSTHLSAQQGALEVLSLEEYLGYVKAYHPLVKQANLKLDASQAELMKARGGFDPKIAVDYDRKEFKETEYFDKLNASFKIPVWFGINLKGGFEQNEGVYLNPEKTVPENGLYSAGIEIPLGQGLWINKRMTALKQAKLYLKQAEAERLLEVNKTLYEATIAYFKWLNTYNKQTVYSEFLVNAEQRFQGVKLQYEQGEKAAVDTLEASITINSRKLALEKADMEVMKSRLELSNYLWLDNEIPVELQATVIPDMTTLNTVDTVLKLEDLELQATGLDQHPKLQALDYKSQILKVEERLKKNALLPKIDLQYNWLTTKPTELGIYNNSDYKAGVRMSWPIFLRKERGNLKKTKIKLQDLDYQRASTRYALQNKWESYQRALASYQRQQELTETVVSDYERLVAAENRKLMLGESSLFIVNSRESKWIEAALKAIDVQNATLKVKADIFQWRSGVL